MGHLPCIQLIQPCRGQGCPKRTNQTGRMKTHLMKTTLGSCPQTGGNFNTHNISGQQVFTGFLQTVCLGQDGGQHRCRCMNHAFRVRIIIIQSMNQQTIHNRRITGRQRHIHANHRYAIGRGLRNSQDACQGFFSKVILGGRVGNAQGIHDQIFCPFPDLFRNAIKVDA